LYPVCAECMRWDAEEQPEHFCALCRTPFLNARPLDESGLCRLCALGLTRYDAAYGFGTYQGTLGRLVQVFKYGRVRSLARPLGERLASAMPRDERFDAVVPMPLHWRKYLKRGFNQSELLAREVCRRRGLVLLDGLRRRRHTPAQAGLTSHQRRANVAGAFFVPRSGEVQGKRLLLVDDVLTTGATANAAAAALKRAGAARVSVLVLARTDRRQTGGLSGAGPRWEEAGTDGTGEG